MLPPWQRTTVVMHNLIFLKYDNHSDALSPAGKTARQIYNALRCQHGSWQGEKKSVWINKEQRISLKLICKAFIVKLVQANNNHASENHTYSWAILPPKLSIHSSKTAAFFCPVKFRFFHLVLLVRPAKHRDHRSIALLELKSCVLLWKSFESVQALSRYPAFRRLEIPESFCVSA